MDQAQLTVILGDLEEELQASLVAMQPATRGLQDLMLVSLSEPALAEVASELDRFQRREQMLNSSLNLIEALKQSLVQLVQDGYPELPKEEVSPEVYAELAQQGEDLKRALQEFVLSKAVTMTISLGAPVQKT